MVLLSALALVAWWARSGRGADVNAAVTTSPSTAASRATSEASATATNGNAPGLTPTCTPGASGPLREDRQFDGATTKVAVNFSVSLPSDYYTACKTYPVIYSLHGKTQTNATFLDEATTLREAMAAGVLDEAIIVTPDSYSDGRWENRENGPAEDNFIVELIPYVEQNFRVKSGPSYRLLTGFSMGGHGAFRFGLKYPSTFAAVYSVDGAMAPVENYLEFVQGKTSADFHLVSVGGQLNGSRVQGVIDGLTGTGITIPYTYYDDEHVYATFIASDKAAGWPAVKFLQSNLGRQM